MKALYPDAPEPAHFASAKRNGPNERERRGPFQCRWCQGTTVTNLAAALTAPRRRTDARQKKENGLSATRGDERW